MGSPLPDPRAFDDAAATEAGVPLTTENLQVVPISTRSPMDGKKSRLTITQCCTAVANPGPQHLANGSVQPDNFGFRKGR